MTDFHNLIVGLSIMENRSLISEVLVPNCRRISINFYDTFNAFKRLPCLHFRHLLYNARMDSGGEQSLTASDFEVGGRYRVGLI
jgi:hypothetical protein